MAKKVHQRTRNDHASEIAEDYVEAIAEAIDVNGICRSIDWADRFAVTHATVNNHVARLQRDGLVHTEPYQPIELTAAGKRLATTSRKRHDIVRLFLEAIGVSKQTASVDSEGIEHHVSRETLDAMKHVLDHGWPAREA
ncbi:MAG: manganese-binding transcriptional regulator MntR [Planctomycetota bacterium]